MLHVISTQCVANDFHMTAPWPPEHTVGDSSWHSEKSKNLEMHFSMRLLLLLLLSVSFFAFLSNVAVSTVFLP